MWRFVVCLAAAFATLAGCTKISTQANIAGGNQWTHHGVLRWAENGEPDNLMPEIGNSQTDVDLSMFWAGYLFNWNDRNEFVPELARQVPTFGNGGISKDGLSITYQLRKGVKWQDGAPFTADDVIFSYQQVMNPENFITSRTGYELISRIDKKDDYTIVVHLEKKYAPFVASFFTMSATPFCILPKHILGPWVAQHGNLNQSPFSDKPVGTGPFEVVKWTHGSSITMVANPHYWRGPPKLREIEFIYVPNDTTILTLWESHQIDFQYLVSSEELMGLRKVDGIHAYLTPFTQYAEIALNSQNPILKDVRIRRALALATNAGALINKVRHGVDTLGDSDQPAFLWAHGSHNKRYDFDPKRAALLLDGAGWRLGMDGFRHKSGQRLSLYLASISGIASAEHTEEIIQAQWRQVGVDLQIKNYPASLMLADYGSGGIIQTGKFEVAYSSIANGVDPDDSWLWMCNQWPPRGQNVYHYCNRELDSWENIALSDYDQSRRRLAYDRIQQILTNDEPTIVLWYSRRIDVANSDLKGYKPAHAVTTFWNTWEWQI
jgi:peptide/nickel transport system substrate-binding protein